MAHPVAARPRPAPVNLARMARAAHAFGVSLPIPAIAGVAGLVVTELVVLVAWGADTRAQAGAGAALRIGADLWLLAHGATLRLPDGQVRVLPLGLAALPFFIAASSGYRLAAARAVELAPIPLRGAVRAIRRPHRASARTVAADGAGADGSEPGAGSATGAATALATAVRARKTATSEPEARRPRRRVRSAWLAVDIAAVVFTQTLLVCFVSLAASTSQVRPTTGLAVLGAAGLSLLGATAGVLAGHRRVRGAWRRIPAVARVPLLAGGAATAGLGAVGALGLAVALVVRLPAVTDAAEDLNAGFVGGVGLLAIQLALLPNLVVWALCYALGTGFAAGPNSTVMPSQATPSTLPDLPVLRLVPTGAVPGWAWVFLAAAPLAAGLVLALAVRRVTPVATLGGRLSVVAVASAVCALLVGLLAALSGGGIGTAAASRFGPSPGWAMLATFAEVGMAAALVTSAAELVRRHG